MDSILSNDKHPSTNVQDIKKIVIQPGTKVILLPKQKISHNMQLTVKDSLVLAKRVSDTETPEPVACKKSKIENSPSQHVNTDSEPVYQQILVEDIIDDGDELNNFEAENTSQECLNDELLENAEDYDYWDRTEADVNINNIDEDDYDEDLYTEEYFTPQSIATGIIYNETSESQNLKKLQNDSGNISATQLCSQHLLKSPKRQLTTARFAGGSSSSKHKVADKFPEVPIPSTINQYGDCLKTRLGRYHYGLTLNDPPFQFFQGVLKGASGQTLAVMFGDTNLIGKLGVISADEIGHFVIDTTFKVIPKSTKGINRVLTISLIFQNQVIPLWFAAVYCSSPELYKRIIIEFQQHVLDWPFKSVLLNYEPAICKAVLELFPDTEIYGSWFYYCYSIWNVILNKNLADKCKSDNALMMAVKLLMVLPYLPPVGDTPSSISMVEGFEYVKTYTLEKGLPSEFVSVLNFVAEFWFNQVKTENFTIFGKQTRALNYVEIVQLALLSFMKPNGNIWTLNYSFQSVSKTAHVEFMRYLNGKRLTTKKNRGKKFNVPIRQNLKKLMMGTQDIAAFLEKSTVYCDEILDILLHPLYPTTTNETSHFGHFEGWKLKICDS